MEEDILARFAYYQPSSDAVGRNHAEVRAILAEAAANLDAILDPGREKALVLTKLEEAMFWANASVARNQTASKIGTL